MSKVLGLPWEALHAAAQTDAPFLLSGRVTGVTGLAITAQGPRGAIGDLCAINTVAGGQLLAEIVGF
ncbi:MAG: hypothetical protein M1602_03525, partial [Firmicutes bacterium]|nr:hypothetical protein [Bacillota bacterium]